METRHTEAVVCTLTRRFHHPASNGTSTQDQLLRSALGLATPRTVAKPPQRPLPAPEPAVNGAAQNGPAAAHAGPIPPALEARLVACLGPECYDRYFQRKARPRLTQSGLEIHVPSRFMADLLGRRFGDVLRQAVCAETGVDAPVSFRVVPDPPAGACDHDAAAGRRGRARPLANGHAPTHASLQPPAAPPRKRHTAAGEAHGPHAWANLQEFIVGQSNRLAHGAALRMAQDPPDLARAVSPLFIHGGCGLGKTHLLQGIARRFKERNPGAVVRYTTGETFTNEFIAAVRDGAGANGSAASRADRFRKLYRNVDLLCIDDVHFLANKQATQSELLHTFDAIDLSGARVVLASDGHPRQIQRFSDALVSRFLAGMVVRLDPPDRELRQQIIRAIAVRRRLPLEDSAVRAISEFADHASNGNGHPAKAGPSIRELEGMLNRVEAVWRLLLTRGGAQPAAAIGRLAVEQALGGGNPADPTDTSPSPRRIAKPIRIEQIISTVCRELDVELSELTGRGRHKRVVLARSVIAHLARRMTTMSYPEIARGMGRPNHSTIVTACQRLKAQMDAGDGAGLEGEFAGLSLVQLADRFAGAITRQA